MVAGLLAADERSWIGEGRQRTEDGISLLIYLLEQTWKIRHGKLDMSQRALLCLTFLSSLLFAFKCFADFVTITALKKDDKATESNREAH